MSFPSVIYLSDTTQRRFSPNIWHDCPIEAIRAGRMNGQFFDDDFLSFPKFDDDVTVGAPSGDFETQAEPIVDNAARGKEQYHTYRDVGVTLRALGTGVVGAIRVEDNDADNDECVLRLSKVGTFVNIHDLVPKRMWFEARIRKESIADNALAFFVGLCQQSATANALIDHTGEVRNDYLIGFRTKHDAGEELDFIYRRLGGDVQEKIVNLHTMVAGTYVNVGFKFDAGASGGMRIDVFVDNVRNATSVPRSEIVNPDIFPVRREMNPIMMTKTGEAVESTFTMDHWACATLE